MNKSLESEVRAVVRDEISRIMSAPRAAPSEAVASETPELTAGQKSWRTKVRKEAARKAAATRAANKSAAPPGTRKSAGKRDS
jgi:hypothetical protein